MAISSAFERTLIYRIVSYIACALAGVTTTARADRARAWGVARSLRCGTVSNAFVLLSPI